jgi:XFP-like protein/phosphoglucomutase/phosphomannomutase-like protein
MAAISPLAGKPAPPSVLVNVTRLIHAYYNRHPNPSLPAQRVGFGTSGHRGSSLDGAFNEDHIVAITQAICLHRKHEGIDGPLFIGFDTHALSEPAFVTALEVLAANGVDVMVDARGGYTPTPVVSHAVLGYTPKRSFGRDWQVAPIEGGAMSPEISPLSTEELRRMHAYWRAANYLSVEQIYLYDNPLLREPLRRSHVQPRLLGHWGTTPGLNLIYVQLNRVIKQHDLDMIYVIGPGHGGPALVANAYLEGTYSEVYPDIGQDADGMRKLFKQSASRAGSRATSPRRPPGRSTRAASLATRCRTRTGPPSTIRT